MRKKLFVLLFVFIFFLGSVDVWADANDYKKETDYMISYDITKFKVTENTMHFEGWSFLSHMDNYGGHNMRTWIVAYTGNWDTNWNNDPDSSCKNNKNCYAVSAKHGKVEDKTIDLYYIRCTGNACSKDVRENQLRKKLRDGDKTFEDASCIHNGTYGGSHCTYYNVGFQADISINNIIAKFSNTKNIKFRIVTEVKYGKKVKYGKSWGKSPKVKVDSSDIGIIPDSCDTVFGKRCVDTKKEYATTIHYLDEEGNTIKKKRSVTIGGISKQIYFTAINSRLFKTSDGISTDSGEFIAGHTYKLTSTKVNGKNMSVTEIKKFHNYKGACEWASQPCGEEFYGRRFHLNNGYWAWSAWTKVYGNLVLDLTEDIEPPPPPPPNEGGGCPEQTKYCIGSGCHYDEKTCEFTWDNPPEINSLNDKCDITRNACDSTKYDTSSCAKTVEKVYYYRLSSAEVKKFFPNVILKYNSSYDVKIVGGYYYFPIRFYGNVDFKQNAELNLNFSNRQNVDSGRSFPYSFDYKVNASWDYHGTYLENASENNTYVSFIYVDIEDNNNKVSQRKVYVSLKLGDKLYSLDNGQVTEFNYSVDFYKNFVKDKVSGNARSLSESLNYVHFPDSNDANSNLWVDDAGSFRCSVHSADHWEAGIVNSATCSYTIKPAYFKNDGSGNIVYGVRDGYTKDTNQGSLYYVPLNLKTGASFQFSVSAKNLSLIHGINYEYTPTCSVLAVDRLDKLKYRPIDTSNPFPKNKISKNWQDYINSKPNAMDRVMNHSFDDISYQTKKLDNSVKSKLKEIKKNIGDYESYSDLGVDALGRSMVIWNENQYNLFSIKQGNHCRVNQYEQSCDKVQGS